MTPICLYRARLVIIAGALLACLLSACTSSGPTPTPTLTLEQKLALIPTPTPRPTRSVEQISLALSTSKFLDGKHAAKGVQCEGCHQPMPPQAAPKKETCLVCHGGTYEAMGNKTANSQPNPHRSHNGEVECVECHHAHAPFELYCRQCHKEFDFDRWN